MSSPRNQLKVRHAVGIWEDMEGGIHFAIPELLEHFGLPDTPEMRAHALAMCQEILKNAGRPPTTTIMRTGRCPCGGAVRVTEAEEKSYGDFHCTTCGNYLKESELKK